MGETLTHPAPSVSVRRGESSLPVRIEPRHDFGAKLRQPRALPRVQQYVDWQRAVREARRKGESEPSLPSDWAPLSIQIDLTTACNSMCPGCIDIEILNRRETHNFGNLLESVGYMIDRGLLSAILIGGGEPTIHPKFREMVRFLKDRAVHVGIVSNGLYPEPIFDIAPILTPPDWLRISLDAGSNPTFQALRKPRHPVTLEKVCEEIRRIRELNSSLLIGFSFVVSWPGLMDNQGRPIAENIDEMVMAAELARRSGFSYISFKAYLVRDMTGSEAIDPNVIMNFDLAVSRIRDELSKAQELKRPGFEISVSRNLQAILDDNWRDFMDQPTTCHKKALQWTISPLGTYSCPAWRGDSRARFADPDPCTGDNVATTPAALAETIGSFNAHDNCSQVVCFYHGMNWWLEDVIEGRDTLPLEGVPGVECFL